MSDEPESDARAELRWRIEEAAEERFDSEKAFSSWLRGFLSRAAGDGGHETAWAMADENPAGLEALILEYGMLDLIEFPEKYPEEIAMIEHFLRPMRTMQ